MRVSCGAWSRRSTPPPTMRLADSLDEQATLEAILEASKPPLPPEVGALHYLLATPFRYRPQSARAFGPPSMPASGTARKSCARRWRRRVIGGCAFCSMRPAHRTSRRCRTRCFVPPCAAPRHSISPRRRSRVPAPPGPCARATPRRRPSRRWRARRASRSSATSRCAIRSTPPARRCSSRRPSAPPPARRRDLVHRRRARAGALRARGARRADLGIHQRAAAVAMRRGQRPAGERPAPGRRARSRRRPGDRSSCARRSAPAGSR